MVVSEFEYYGRVAYEAFKMYCNHITEVGTPMSEWDELGDDTQQAWIAAGVAVVKAYQGEV